MNPEIILGPPGTGKTTTLLDVVDEELASGVDPARIGFLTFTRRAAEEAVGRACVKFKLKPADFPYFRTLHSLCFRQLGLKRGDVLEGAKMQEFARYAGVCITSRGWSEDGTLDGYEMGDRILFAENLARVRQIDLREQYSRDDDRLPWSEVQRVSKALVKFKVAKGLMDYTDMLTEFVRSGIVIELDVLVIDEAQDCSLLQWLVIQELAKTARRVVIAGDDDQGIYRWAGADVDHLIDMQGKARVLNQSYRVPPVIQKVADEIISTVKHRRPKKWKPRAGDRGVVTRVAQFAEADASGEDVLVLARNSYVLREQVEGELKRQGIVYERFGRSSIKLSYLEAISRWEALRKGKRVSVADVRAVYDLMSSGVGVARGHKKLPKYKNDEEELSIKDLQRDAGLLTVKVWHEALDRLPEEELSYMLAALRRGEKLRKRPRVRVSTIHGAKGGEADHVIIFKEMARRTHREMYKEPDDEKRVWYVGVTRARKRLTIVESQTKQEVPWL